MPAFVQPVRKSQPKCSAEPATPNGETLTPGRDERTGRFGPGNTAALKHGGRSRQVQEGLLPEQADVVAALRERQNEIENDLGGSDKLSALARDLVGRYLQLDLHASFLATLLQRAGALTGKGRTRAALSAWLSIIDRQERIAARLGIERRAKPVEGVQDYLQRFEGRMATSDGGTK